MGSEWIARIVLALGIAGQLATAACADVIYLSDYTNNAIVKLVNGVVTPFATGLSGPLGMMFDTQGNLYCANSTANSISKITPDGVVHSFASGMNSPEYLAFNAGNLYASNGNAAGGGTAIYKITLTGIVSMFSTAIPRPNGLAFDNSGNLYAVDYSSAPSNVYKISPGGVVSGFTTLHGTNAHARGFDLAFDGTGTFDVVDDVAGIEKITAAGAVSNLTPPPPDQCFGMSFDSSGSAYTLGRSNLYQIATNGAITPIPIGGNYQYQSVVVQTVPEPAAIFGIVAGIALLARRRQRTPRA